MALTHPEKDEMIKQLKQKIKDLEVAAKIAISTEKEMYHKGFSFKKIGRDYHLILLVYSEDGVGKVIESRNLGPDYAIALYKGKQYLVEEILIPLSK